MIIETGDGESWSTKSADNADLAALMRAGRGRAQPHDLPIRKFLDLSTGHLQENTCNTLGTVPGLRAVETEYGWLIYAGEWVDEYAKDGGWPAELRAIIALAREHDCAYVMFDRDAPLIDVLPHWDW
ncbi:MAG: hypothetical protein ABWZ30_01010 [Jiangellaceae bacterium]